VSEDDPDVAYLTLPTHRDGPCRVSRALRLAGVMGANKGPDVVLDFDEDGVLVGIELLA
jgi:hypothetical protein